MRDRGFSIVEMILSIGILGTSALLVIGITTTLLTSSQKSVDLTAGTVLASSLLRQQAYQLLYDGEASASFFALSHSSPTTLAEGTYRLNRASYTYRVTVQDLSLSDTLYHGGRPTSMKRLDAQVQWWDESSGGAMRETAASRVLWPTAKY